MKESSPPKPQILYAFQGTGNGHASRAAELIPILQNYADVKVLCSGTNRQLKLNFDIDYQLNGISFSYNKSGGLSYWQTLREAKLWNFYREVRSLDLSAFDLVLNDFEPVSAYAARSQKARILGLSHQAAFLSAKTPRASKRNQVAEWVFRNYAPSKEAIGFHFKAYDHFIKGPVLRSTIGEATGANGKTLVYLPAYSAAFLKEYLSSITNANWLVFSKEHKEVEEWGNLQFHPISGADFLTELRACSGVLCSAGFEAPAEALYLGKKLFVIPIQGQYEQDCNAAALAELGIPSLKKLNREGIPKLQKWLKEEAPDLDLKIQNPESLIINVLKEEGFRF